MTGWNYLARTFHECCGRYPVVAIAAPALDPCGGLNTVLHSAESPPTGCWFVDVSHSRKATEPVPSARRSRFRLMSWRVEHATSSRPWVVTIKSRCHGSSAQQGPWVARSRRFGRRLKSGAAPAWDPAMGGDTLYESRLRVGTWSGHGFFSQSEKPGRCFDPRCAPGGMVRRNGGPEMRMMCSAKR